MTSVTDKQVTAAIRAVVEEQGADYTYPILDGKGCVYVYNDKPSCLVGRVLHRLGADIQDLKRCDDFGSLSTQVLEMADIEMSEAARMALRYAQSSQDQRCSWGYALDRYLNVLVLAYEEDKA